MEKKLITSIIASIIILTWGSFALAASDYVPLESIPGLTEFKNGVNFGEYLAGVLKFVIAMGAILSIVMIIVAGTKYIAAGTMPSALEDAKDSVLNAFTGLALVLASYMILYSINPNLVNFNLDLQKVKGIEPVPLAEVQLAGDFPDDTAERSALYAGKVQINNGPCTKIGQTGCTSVHGLQSDVIDKLISLKNTCGSSCIVVVTGGTEYWLHGGKDENGNRILDMSKNGTYHKPYPESPTGGRVVDLSINNEVLNNYIRTTGTQILSGCASGIRYQIGNIVYVDERISGNPAHWHVCFR